MIKNVFKNQKRSLLTVGMVAVVYIVVSAIAIFNIEPDSFTIFLMLSIGLQYLLQL